MCHQVCSRCARKLVRVGAGALWATARPVSGAALPWPGSTGKGPGVTCTTPWAEEEGGAALAMPVPQAQARQAPSKACRSAGRRRAGAVGANG